VPEDADDGSWGDDVDVYLTFTLHTGRSEWTEELDVLEGVNLTDFSCARQVATFVIDEPVPLPEVVEEALKVGWEGGRVGLSTTTTSWSMDKIIFQRQTKRFFHKTNCFGY
jgi:hypothetical protein